MGHHEHKSKAPKQVSLALVTVSTSRGEAEDRSGPVMAERCEAAGHRVREQRIINDGVVPVRECLLELSKHKEIKAVFFSGGTGIAAADLSIEALEPFWIKNLPGFGELFRRLSYDEIGSAAMLSRAEAGVVELSGRCLLVAVLPGSPNAVRLALDELLLPELGHLVYEMER